MEKERRSGRGREKRRKGESEEISRRDKSGDSPRPGSASQARRCVSPSREMLLEILCWKAAWRPVATARWLQSAAQIATEQKEEEKEEMGEEEGRGGTGGRVEAEGVEGSRRKG